MDMRLGTHLKSARTRRGLSQAVASLIADVEGSRLSSLEAGEHLPNANDLAAICRAYSVDSPTVFLWMCHELLEHVVAQDGEGPVIVDEDLLELIDRMISFLADRGRL